MLGSEVDVVDGNLEEPQAGHTATGGPRSLVLLNLRLIQAQVRGRQCIGNLCLPACNPVSMFKAYSHAEREYVRGHTFRGIFCSRLTSHSTPCGVVRKLAPPASVLVVPIPEVIAATHRHHAPRGQCLQHPQPDPRDAQNHWASSRWRSGPNLGGNIM